MIEAFREAEPERWPTGGTRIARHLHRLPDGLRVEWVSLTDDEIRVLPTHSPRTAVARKSPGQIAARNTRSKRVNGNQPDPDARTIRAIAERLAAGEMLPAVVLVGLPSQDELVVMEGNKRTVPR